jgi:chemotaxis protein methyltransferase CheR
MDDELFNKFRKLIYEVSGIHLGDQKRALVIGRLLKGSRTLGFDDFRNYYDI